MNELDTLLLSAARQAYAKTITGGELRDDTLATNVLAEVQKATDGLDPANAASIQARANTLGGQGFIDNDIVNSMFYRQRTETDIAPYGWGGRDVQMRRMFTLQGNDLIQAAVTATVQKVQSTEWIIDGPKRTAAQAAKLLQESDLGNGWDAFVARFVQDYLTQDNGMFWEVIWSDASADTREMGAPSAGAKIIGLAHLDSGRCRRTGIAEYPVVYLSLVGGYHKLHHSRVVFAADLPNPNERYLGRGFCAMSRCLSVAQTIIRYAAYRTELLDDVPALGLLVLQNINKQFWDSTKKEFNSQRQSNEQFIFSNLMTLFNMDPTKPAGANLIPFKGLWENFSERDFYDMAIDITAMAFGLDRQELAPLATSALGSGAQSTVLAQKSRGKGIGNILSAIERQLNRLLPESCTFHFDFHDDEQDFQKAQIRNQNAGTIIALYGASSGNAKPGVMDKPKPLAGDTLKAFGDPGLFAANTPADAKPSAPGQVPPGLATMPPPPPKETLISRNQALQLLAKEIPEWADILQAEDPTGDVTYDDTELDALAGTDVNDAPMPAVTKALVERRTARYGAPCRITKAGKVRVFKSAPAKPAPRIEHDDVLAAREYLKALGIAT